MASPGLFGLLFLPWLCREAPLITEPSTLNRLWGGKVPPCLSIIAKS
jgi:hypothetical protein